MPPIVAAQRSQRCRCVPAGFARLQPAHHHAGQLAQDLEAVLAGDTPWACPSKSRTFGSPSCCSRIGIPRRTRSEVPEAPLLVIAHRYEFGQRITVDCPRTRKERTGERTFCSRTADSIRGRGRYPAGRCSLVPAPDLRTQPLLQLLVAVQRDPGRLDAVEHAADGLDQEGLADPGLVAVDDRHGMGVVDEVIDQQRP